MNWSNQCHKNVWIYYYYYYWLEELLWNADQWWQMNCYHSCQIIYFLQHDKCEHDSSLFSHQDRLKLDWVEVNV